MGYLHLPLLQRKAFRHLAAPARRLWARANDVALNIDTVVDRTQGANHHLALTEKSAAAPMSLYHDPVAYESPDYWYLRKIRRILASDLSSDDVFFDLGCGKGRILAVMAQSPFKKVVGVEFLEDLCECARRNAARLSGKHAPIEVICQDAAIADLSKGTVYFLFNPFGCDTLRAVFENIGRSLKTNPRRIRVVYYNSVHEEVLGACPWLNKSSEFKTQNGLRVTFWSSS